MTILLILSLNNRGMLNMADTKEIRIEELIKLSFHFYENIDILMYRYKRYSK